MCERKNNNTRVVFMGTPLFAAKILEFILERGYNVVGVVTVPDKPSGRGLKVNESAVKSFAVPLNIPILQPVSLKEPQFLDELKSLNGELFVVVAFRMLPKSVWSMPRLGTFNLHTSLLPQYRGSAPINWALINGEKKTGVTTFLIDEKIDTGHILHSEECIIEENDNAGSLHDKLLTLGCSVVEKSIEALSAGESLPIPQPEAENLKPAPKITRETGNIDWSKDAHSVRNLVRGLSPYPAAYSTLTGGGKSFQVKIFEVEALSKNSGKKAGETTSDGKTFLEVQCSEGSIRIVEIQAAGKNRLKINQFLAGWRGGWEGVCFVNM